MKSKGFYPLALVAWALWMLWGFGVQTVWVRLNTEVDGVVVSSRDTPFTGAPRYATSYVVHGSDGRDHAYVAGCTDAALSRSMPVGTHIHKARWQLGYERNGQRVNFPTAVYAAILGTATACLFWGILQWRRTGGRPT